LLRHLVMPGMLDDTAAIMRFVAGLSRDTYVNVMDQYRPAWKARTDPRHEAINRPMASEQFLVALQHARNAGLWRFDTRW
ncbi:MAG: radical SAM protein, partial [Dehalococcoidia bacterium]